jgi:hypothetical protein
MLDESTERWYGIAEWREKLERRMRETQCFARVSVCASSTRRMFFS